MEKPISEWIVGASPDGDREYIVHTIAPRFIARLFMPDEGDYDDEAIGEGAGQSVTFDLGSDEHELCVAEWLDPVPVGDDLAALLARAMAAFEVSDIHAAELAEEEAINPMGRDELRACGLVIFGERWQTPLAHRLGVNPRTVRRWVAGDIEVSPSQAHIIRGWAMRAMRDAE